MNKNSNMLFGSKQMIQKNIVDADDMFYGAGLPQKGENADKVAVRFAVHEGDTVAKGADGQLVFNKLGNTGAIYLGDTLVSSKILDVTYAQKTNASAGVNLVSVKFLKEDGSIDVSTFEVVDEAAVKGWLNNINGDNNKKFGEIDASIADIKGYLDDTNIASATKDVVVTPTLAAGDYKKTYDLKVNIDGSTLMRDANGVLSAKKTIAIVEGAAETAEAGHKYLALKAENGVIENKIDLCDIVGTGLIKSASYNNTTNKLTLTLATADGAEKDPIVIDLADLFDINDITIKEDSSNYLDFNIDVSTGKIGTKMISLLGKDGKPLSGIVANGLLDASVAKSYIDQKTTDLAVSASGDSYVNAGVDARDNKHINVSANVDELTIGKEGDADTTISGVSTTLVSGGEVASKVSTFVNNRIDEEIKKLDVPEATVEATNARFKYSETDGKVAISDFALDYSTVEKTPTTSTANAPKTDAAIAVTNGSKLAVGSDIEKVAQYAADKVTEEMHRVDAKIAALGGDVTSDDAAVANVQVKTEGGQVSDVIVTTISAGVNRTGDAEGNRVIAATNVNGALVGSDVALIKGYVDDKIADVTGAQDSAVTVSDASSFITTTITMENGALKQADSTLSYQKAVYANDSNTVTTNGLVDGQLALDMINDRIADLDKKPITSKDTNEYVSITLKVEDGISSITSVAVKTHDVSTATADSEGLATAFSTRSYIDTRLTWAVI